MAERSSHVDKETDKTYVNRVTLARQQGRINAGCEHLRKARIVIYQAFLDERFPPDKLRYEQASAYVNAALKLLTREPIE